MKRETMNGLMKISRIAGLLEGLSSMQGAQISKKTAILLEEAAIDLDMYAGDVYAKEVSGDEADEAEAEKPGE